LDAKNVSLFDLSTSQLRKAAELKDRIEQVMTELAEILKYPNADVSGNGRN